MEYYLLVTIMYNDGTAESKSIYTYNSLDNAVANFHKQLGGWMAKTNVYHILAMVVNSEGGIIRNETYTSTTTTETTES